MQSAWLLSHVCSCITLQLAEELDDIIAQGPLDDAHSGYVLYLGLQEFKALSIHIEEKLVDLSVLVLCVYTVYICLCTVFVLYVYTVYVCLYTVLILYVYTVYVCPCSVFVMSCTVHGVCIHIYCF